MHISTSAIYVILLSFLGGSKAAPAETYADAFGVTNYGIRCQDRIYPKHIIYAAAKSYCDLNKTIPSFGNRNSADLGFRSRFFYYRVSKTDINNLLKSSHHIVPILVDGKLYPLVPDSGSRKNSADEMDMRNPVPDRLVIDVNCDIVGAFTDFYYTHKRIEHRVKGCRAIKSPLGLFSPGVRSSERSQQRSPQRSPPGSRDQSPERLLASSSEQTSYQSAETLPVLSRQKTRHHSAEEFTEVP